LPASSWWWEALLVAGPGDEVAPDRAGRGRLRAAHADREQVIDVLKAAFVQGRLTKDEFEARIGQALASRTYAELAAAIIDVPPGPSPAQPPMPAWAQDPKPVLRPGPVIMAASALYAGLWALALLVPADPLDGVAAYAVAMLTLFIIVGMIGFGIAKFASWHQERSRGQRPRRPAPRAGGQASGRLRSGGPAGQFLPIDDRQQHTAEAAPSRLPRPQWPGWGSPRRRRPRGLLGAGGTIAVQLIHRSLDGDAHQGHQ
jgi:hypothetical protein